MTLADLTPLFGLGSAAVTATAYAVGAWLDGRTRRTYYEAVRDAKTPEQLALLEKYPPRRFRWRALSMLLIMAGSTYLMCGTTPSELPAVAADGTAPTKPTPAKRRGPVQKSCTSSSDCGAGQKCERGTCVAMARQLNSWWIEPPPSLREDCAEGRVQADRIVPGWEDQAPHVTSWRDMPPEWALVGGVVLPR